VYRSKYLEQSLHFFSSFKLALVVSCGGEQHIQLTVALGVLSPPVLLFYAYSYSVSNPNQRKNGLLSSIVWYFSSMRKSS